ncbi:uncharacterized protein LOC143148485 isoform X2 [Ptiloglossa arizonensis]|uniref:uncharacterized protein LOC143148485 isoform X2 n=1 Tax=Ptiloglossa arizonensis TaxID=3350558 RepID=UPI003F9F5310
MEERPCTKNGPGERDGTRRRPAAKPTGTVPEKEENQWKGREEEEEKNEEEEEEEGQPGEDTTGRRGNNPRGEGTGRKKAERKDGTRGGPHTHRANVTEAIQVHIVMRRYPSCCIIVQSATATRYFRDHAFQHETDSLRTEASSICSVTGNDILHAVGIPLFDTPSAGSF